MAKKLELLFLNQGGKSVTLSIDEPAEPVNEQAVEAAMDEIISNNVFTSREGAFVKKRGARLVERTVQNFEFED
ncbi:DUF2922 domain-containing protein [Evansella clarkii]|jgi:hypothetical protein|uniref:DUF2922 domain-containing protein n=1 Tax=Evansella clarkii TaxID=79879 RepID=UPI000996C691|nr:DUF2922 domain-containing protein [Evansella clarkii]